MPSGWESKGRKKRADLGVELVVVGRSFADFIPVSLGEDLLWAVVMINPTITGYRRRVRLPGDGKFDIPKASSSLIGPVTSTHVIFCVIRMTQGEGLTSEAPAVHPE